MVTSFSIKPSDAKNIKLVKDIKLFCLRNNLNFSGFVVTALKKHYKDIKAKK